MSSTIPNPDRQSFSVGKESLPGYFKTRNRYSLAGFH